ncbi:hypothetical protein D3C81_783720 [compost metagenome]
MQVNGTEYGLWIIRIHEGAWPKVNAFSAKCHVVRIHYSMNKTNQLPLGNELGLTLNHFLKQGQVTILICECSLKMPL